MSKKILGAILGVAVLAASTAASAHMDVAIGLGVPGTVYAPVEPVYVAPPVAYAPASVAVGYGGYDDGRARDWRERREWREREWRRHEWREHEWREHEWRERRWRGY
jgi:hypothetical protein